MSYSPQKKNTVSRSASFNYVITVTSGSYDDYEHGVLFAVPSEQQAIMVADLLNKYSVFRSRFREAVWEWEFEYSINTQMATDDKELILKWAKQKARDLKRFIKDNYELTKDFKAAESLLLGTGLTENPADWGEDVVFAYQRVPVHSIEMNELESLSGIEE